MRYLDLGPIKKIRLDTETPLFDWDFPTRDSASHTNAKKRAPHRQRVFPPRSLMSVYGRLIAYMSFPEDDWQRCAMLVGFRQALSSALDLMFDDSTVRAGLVKKYGREIAPQMLWLLEGLARDVDRDEIGSFPPPQMSKSGDISYDNELAAKGIDASRCAGLVLYNFRRVSDYDKELRTSASLNKVAFLMEERCGFTRSEIMRAWTYGKSVSHLTAAWFEMATLADSVLDYDRSKWVARFGPFEDFGPCMKYLAVFLTLAREYQTFGLQYAPLGANRTILHPEKIWRLPDELDVPKIDRPALALDPATLDLLKTYRAPKSI